MSVIRVVFMGTPVFAKHHLELLHKDPHYKVVGVVSQPDRKQGRKLKLTASPVKAFAIEHNLNVITPEKFNNEDVYQTIQSWKPEVVVVVAYGQIISSQFLKTYDQKVVNVHGSLLPQWRGAAPIQRSIMAGDTMTGVCLQVMKKKLDAGDVIGERKISLSQHINAIELHDRLMEMGADLLHIELMDYIRGHLTPKVQDEKLATYAHKLSKAESKIDWKQSALNIHNKVRGMVLGPGTYTHFHGLKYKILKTEVIDEPSEGPGVVHQGQDGQLLIGTSDGLVRILKIQPESRARMDVVDFLKGHPIKKGELFGE